MRKIAKVLLSMSLTFGSLFAGILPSMVSSPTLTVFAADTTDNFYFYLSSADVNTGVDKVTTFVSNVNTNIFKGNSVIIWDTSKKVLNFNRTLAVNTMKADASSTATDTGQTMLTNLLSQLTSSYLTDNAKTELKSWFSNVMNYSIATASVTTAVNATAPAQIACSGTMTNDEMSALNLSGKVTTTTNDSSSEASSSSSSTSSEDTTSTKTVAGRKSTDPIIQLGATAYTEVSGVISSANTYITDELGSDASPILVGDGSNVSFSVSNYKKLSTAQKQDFMKNTLYLIRNCGASSQTISKFYNWVAERDSTAAAAVKVLTEDYGSDFDSVNNWIVSKGWNKGVQKLLGALTLLIFMGLSISFVTDLLYINVPTIRLLIDGAGKGVDYAADHTRHVGGFLKHAHWLSKEAVDAIHETEANGGETNWCYLKKKVTSITIMSIVLVLMITGNLYKVIGWIIDYVTYVLNIFGFGI
jgi:hypothetical protein